MPGQIFGERKPYLSIIQGIVRQKVSESTKGAEKRIYKTISGLEGTKWELSFKSWKGIIQELRLRDSEYGEALEVIFDDAVLTVPVESRYFDDLVKKLMNVDINQEVLISPYDFEADGKRKMGVTVWQGDKIASYYEDKNRKAINGIPAFPENWKSYKKDDWKLYSLTVKKFLKGEIDKINTRIEKIELPIQANTQELIEEEFEIPVMPDEEDAIKIEDVPF